LAIPQKQERLVFIPVNEEENKMSQAVKRLAIQDETTQHHLLKEALQLLFVKHNLDLGGNPQRQLFSFTLQTLVKSQKCGFARHPKGVSDLAVMTALYKPKNQVLGVCSFHRVSVEEDVRCGCHVWGEVSGEKRKELQ
jgi:hypothetical protein